MRTPCEHWSGQYTRPPLSLAPWHAGPHQPTALPMGWKGTPGSPKGVLAPRQVPLLNAYRYRQAQHGILTSCTHRLVVQGHSSMLFGTVSTAQKFHIIGYAVCDKEDDAAHDHVFRSLKREVERIVAERTRDQVKI